MSNATYSCSVISASQKQKKGITFPFHSFPFQYIWTAHAMRLVGHWHFLNGSTNYVLISLWKLLQVKEIITFIPWTIPFISMAASMSINAWKIPVLRGQTVAQSSKATRHWLLLLLSLKAIRSHWASDQNTDPFRSHLPMIHGDIN